MSDWHTYTPDGRELFISHGEDEWVVRCGSQQARSRILDVALIEAIRADDELFTHGRRTAYAAWIRAQAERIEQERARP
jgi:hypothetical protein